MWIVFTENQLTRAQVILGNKILVYTSCCLAGRAYPYGNIPVHLAEKVQADVFQCITTLHSRNPSENEESYPYLRCLLEKQICIFNLLLYILITLMFLFFKGPL